MTGTSALHAQIIATSLAGHLAQLRSAITECDEHDERDRLGDLLKIVKISRQKVSRYAAESSS